jgi:hypothetical protein
MMGVDGLPLPEHLRLTDVFTLEGLFLGTKLKNNPDESRFEKVINKIADTDQCIWF